MALTEMEHWGIVVRETLSGQRSYRYRAETRLWYMISRVFCLRELRHLEALSATLRQAMAECKDKDQRFATQRLAALIPLVTLCSEVLNLTFQEKDFDLGTLQRIAKLRHLFQKQ